MSRDPRAAPPAGGGEPQALLQRAERLRSAGKHDAAAGLARQVLAQNAAHPQALHLLAEVSYAKRDLKAAESFAQRAIAAEPGNAALHFFLGNVLRDAKRADEAVRSLRAAIRLKPDFPQALNNLGNVLKAQGKPQDAAACYQRAIALKPDYALAFYNLGNALRELDRPAQAIARFQRALELKPDYFDALNNLGNTLKDTDRFDRALECYRRALALQPFSPEVHNNIGNTLRELNRLEEATAHYDRAIAVAPEFADAHFGYAVIMLTRGDYLRGWLEYEWRWKAKDFPAIRWSFTQPHWLGEPLEGRTLLLHYEQGYGDNLQLLRYVPLVCERGGSVVLEMQKPLVRLAQSLGAPVRIIRAGEPRPPFDLCCSLMTLPRIFGTTRETIPGPVPYLFADPALAERWRGRLGAGPELKVGIVWAGNPRQATEKKRGVGLEAMRPLLSVPGVRWFSLQVGQRAADLARLPAGAVEDLSGELTDFAETAAALANLDLLITTDTSVVHLAGALARPAWVMLRWAPDWRWELGRDDNLWYPSLRLFRQAQRDDWSAPVAAAREALERLAAGRAR